MITQLAYVVFGVQDPARWRDLLTSVFGFQVTDDSTDVVALRMDHYQRRVFLVRRAEDDLVCAGWQVATPPDLAAISKRLEQRHVTVTAGTADEAIHRGVQALIKFADPDGLATEVVFGPRVASEPFLPGRAMSGFVAGRLGVGHIVVSAPDPARTETFYREDLGFRLSDYGSGPLTFLRCNPRHHSIALAPPSSSGKRLRHVMFEMASLDDVGRAFDVCLRQGQPVTTLIGKHVNDYTVSFYLESPSGFELECSFGGRLVDEATWEVHRYGDREVWGHQRLHGLHIASTQ